MKKLFWTACIAMTISSLPSLPAMAASSRPGAYSEALESVQEARDEGKEAREISEIYLWGATRCRDAGANAPAQELFEAAVKEDPSNAIAHKLYGDYLMGYRGLYEYASYHYYQALELIKDDPGAYEDQLKEGLERSFAIMHREGQDGIPLVANKHVSIFFEGEAQYSRERPRHLDLLGQEMHVTCYLDGPYREEREEGIEYFEGVLKEQKEGSRFFSKTADEQHIGFDQWLDDLYERFMNDYGYIPSDTEILDFDEDGDPITISTRREDKNDYAEELEDRADEIDKERKKTEKKIEALEEELAAIPGMIAEVPGRLPRRTETKRYAAALLFRFGPPVLPYLKLMAERSEVENAGINPDDLDHTYEGTYDRIALRAGKNLVLPANLDLAAYIEGSHRRSELYDPYNDVDVYEEETDEVAAETAFSYNMGHNVLKFTAGGALQAIENDYSDEDSGYSVRGALRWSRYPKPGQMKNSSRFKGKRSTHWEVGVRRYERDYESPTDPTVTETTYQPYFTYEELGLVNGVIDTLVKYEYHHQTFQEGCLDGVYDAHELTLQPTWVPVYRLYDEEFWTGIEHMTVGFPITATYGEGDYERYVFGIKFEGRWVTALGTTIIPSVTFDYATYPHLDRDDWGVFAKCTFRAGPRRHFTQAEIAGKKE